MGNLQFSKAFLIIARSEYLLGDGGKIRESNAMQRRHSFDDFTNLERLDAAVWPRRCRSLCGKRWFEDEHALSECGSNGDSSEWESASSGCEGTLDPFSGLVDKDVQDVHAPRPELYEVPISVPDDLTAFRRAHNWVAGTFEDTLIPRSSYILPTPTYVWKVRRRKLTSMEHFDQKDMEVLELASDIDTDDDVVEEKMEKQLDKFNPNCPDKRSFNQARINWLKQKLAPLRQRQCSSDDSSNSDSEAQCSNAAAASLSKRSEDELYDMDRDSDYEYSHLWGESDNGLSEVEADDSIQDNIAMERGLLEPETQVQNQSLRRKYVQQHNDSPSPEPYLPLPDVTRVLPPLCFHRLGPGDALAYNLKDLEISVPRDMPHVSKHAPQFAPVEEVECNIFESSPFLKRKIDCDNSDEPKVEVKYPKYESEDSITIIASLPHSVPPSPPSPDGSISSYSPPSSDEDEQMEGSGTVRKNPKRCNIKIQVRSKQQIVTPFPTPNSDIESPSKSMHNVY